MALMVVVFVDATTDDKGTFGHRISVNSQARSKRLNQEDVTFAVNPGAHRLVIARENGVAHSG